MAAESRPKGRPLLEGIWVVGAFALGLWLRVRRPGVTEFKYDEVHILDLAWSLLQDVRPVLTGSVGSTGLPNPPLAVYLHAVPVAISPDPRVAVLFMGALSALAIPALYLGLRPYLPRAVVLASALFLALSPWAVLFGRKLGTHIFPLFAVLALWLVVRTLRSRPSWRRSAAAGAGLAVFFHTYLLAALPALGGMVALAVRRRAAGAVVVAAALVFPYVWAVRHGLGALEARGQLLHPEALRFLGMATSGYGVSALHASPASLVQTVLLVVFGGLLVLGLLLALLHRQAAHLTLALWVLVPAALLMLGGRPVFLHYALAVLPANLVLAAVGLHALAGRATLPLALLAALPLGLLSYQTVETLSDARPAYPYGATVEAWRRALSPLLEGTGRGPVFVYGPDAEPDFQGTPAAIRYLLRPRYQVRFLDTRAPHPFLVLREEPAHYVVVGDPPPLLEAAGRPLARSAHPALETWAWPRARQVLDGMQPVGALFGNGAVLAGVRLECAEGRLRVEHLWDLSVVEAAFRGRRYSVFNHLVGPAGELLAQADGLSLPSPSWREGDWLWQRYDLDLPDAVEKADLRVGLYSLVDLQREPVDGANAVPVMLPRCSSDQTGGV